MQIERETGLPVAEINIIVAVGLTLLWAGLGHLYRRRFRRGLVWAGLFAGTLLLSTYTNWAGLFVVSVLNGNLSAMNVAVPGSIMLLCLVDLYLLNRADRTPVEPSR
ncbi:hypothetical protein [Halovenus halobia]|uniref:hypothetical protein n=1 Tax=Halovenus halobia TaxID=3396622 RepID=UPI003F574CE4